jgi:Recombinase
MFGQGHRTSMVTDIARARSAQVRARAADEAAELVSHVINKVRSEGVTSLRALANVLNDRGIRTRRGGAWNASGVKRVLDRVR